MRTLTGMISYHWKHIDGGCAHEDTYRYDIIHWKHIDGGCAHEDTYRYDIIHC